jgi:predicted hotdog family 3-hydroxylacyl-ACP dehydratase
MDEHDLPPIIDLLPHQGVMVLLDRLVAVEEDFCACETVVRASGMFHAKSGGLPAYMGVELMAQTIAALSGYQLWRAGRPIEPGFLIGAPQWVSRTGAFAPGSRLRIEARCVWGDTELMRFSCRILAWPEGESLQEGEINVFKPKNVGEFLKANP